MTEADASVASEGSMRPVDDQALVAGDAPEDVDIDRRHEDAIGLGPRRGAGSNGGEEGRLLATLRFHECRIEWRTCVRRERGDVFEDAGRHVRHVLEPHALELNPASSSNSVHHCVVEALLVAEVPVDGALVDAGLSATARMVSPCQSRTDEPRSNAEPAAMMRARVSAARWRRSALSYERRPAARGGMHALCRRDGRYGHVASTTS